MRDRNYLFASGDMLSSIEGHRQKMQQQIRVLKYWNACNDYPFESYQLEQQIVEHVPLACSFWAEISGTGLPALSRT